MGEFLIGFCFLFMGLDLISHYVPNLQENPEMLEFLTKYTSMGYGSVLVFFLIGIIVTMVAQSSGATFAITLIMCSQGWISYELGCAIILGGNIGTTITPVLASLSGNLAAKRTAMGHVLFNVLGSIIVLALFQPFVSLVADITQWPTTRLSIPQEASHQRLRPLRHSLWPCSRRCSTLSISLS